VFGYGPNGILLAGSDGLQRVSEAGTAAQLHFHEDERLGSDIQTLKTTELMFRVMLTQDGDQRLELVRT
jgi:hypothetical protein